MLKRSSLDLDELMRYPLTPVPYSLGTADGYFNKTNKAVMKNYLAKQLIDTETTTEYANDVFFYSRRKCDVPQHGRYSINL